MLLNEKQTTYKEYHLLPLSARPLDLVYYIFFFSHVLATICVDCLYIYPQHLVPSPLKSLLNFYISTSRDPLIGGLHGWFGDNTHLAWFKSFIWVELLFQLPVFILGMRALKSGSQKIYPLLLVYAAQSSTTTFACLVTVLSPPSHPTLSPLTTQQRTMLLTSYVPFFTIPFVMAIDMFLRLNKLVNKAVKQSKWD